MLPLKNVEIPMVIGVTYINYSQNTIYRNSLEPNIFKSKIEIIFKIWERARKNKKPLNA